MTGDSEQGGRWWSSQFGVDSSPQGGREFLCMVEERFIITGTCNEVAAAVDSHGLHTTSVLEHERRTLQCQILGLANLLGAQTVARFVKSFLTEAGAIREMQEKRQGTCAGWLVDQGVDFAVGDCLDVGDGGIPQLLRSLSRG